jgi:hypothetical protein
MRESTGAADDSNNLLAGKSPVLLGDSKSLRFAGVAIVEGMCAARDCLYRFSLPWRERVRVREYKK